MENSFILEGYLNNKADEFKAKPASGEIPFSKILKKLKVEYEFQKPFIVKDEYGKDKGYIADFYLPIYNCIIEIDWYSHYLPSSKDQDNLKSFLLYNAGYPVIRIDKSNISKFKYINFDLFIKMNIDKIKCNYQYQKVTTGFIESIINNSGLYEVDGKRIKIHISTSISGKSFPKADTIYL